MTNIPTASQRERARGGFTVNVGTRSVAIGLCVLLVALCSSTSIKAQEGRGIGHVLDFEGDWYLDGRPGQALSKGLELPAGGVIRIPTPSRFAFIIIRYANNQIISRRCRNGGECEQPILLPRAVQHQSSWQDYIIEKMMAVLRSNPVGISINAGRSDDGALREAVVQIKGGQVDLAPLFSEMNKGTYDVRVERRMPKGTTAEAGSAKPFAVKWDSTTNTATPAVMLQPGLYEMVLQEKRGAEYKPTLTTAWFIVSSHKQFAKTDAQFSEATRLTATWHDDVSQETVRSFLRAFLIHLVSQSAPTKM